MPRSVSNEFTAQRTGAGRQNPEAYLGTLSDAA